MTNQNWCNSEIPQEIVYTVDIDDITPDAYIVTVEHAGEVMHTETVTTYADATERKQELEYEWNIPFMVKE